MKHKLTLFSLAFFLLLISLSLVYAFESDVYQIGIEIPSTDDSGGEETPINGDTGGSSPGGGGGSSYICYEKWQCGDWSECDEDTQTRTCEDLNKCGTTKNKPLEFQACGAEETDQGMTLKAPSEKGFFSILTGAVIGGVTDFSKTTGGKVVLIFGGMVGILAVFVAVKNHGLKKSAKEVETFSDKEVED